MSYSSRPSIPLFLVYIREKDTHEKINEEKELGKGEENDIFSP